MALKKQIDEATWKKLSEHLQGEYKKNDDGSYTLDVEGDEDTGALKRAKDHEKEQRKAAEALLRETKKKLDDLTEEHETLQTQMKTKGDERLTATEKAWQAKLAKREQELNDQLGTLQKVLKANTVDTVAMQLATELAGDNAEIMLPHIQRRLSADIVDGKAVTKVLGADGSVSALNPDELKKEFLSNTRFSAIVVGSKASGGGAGGTRKSGSVPKKLSEMSATEEAQFANANPGDYARMVAEQGATTR
jgi:hypothetical protein